MSVLLLTKAKVNKHFSENDFYVMLMRADWFYRGKGQDKGQAMIAREDMIGVERTK